MFARLVELFARGANVQKDQILLVQAYVKPGERSARESCVRRPGL
jgi:hypothetical protein